MPRCKNTNFFSEIETLFKKDADNAILGHDKRLESNKTDRQNTQIGDQVQRADENDRKTGGAASFSLLLVQGRVPPAATRQSEVQGVQEVPAT